MSDSDDETPDGNPAAPEHAENRPVRNQPKGGVPSFVAAIHPPSRDAEVRDQRDREAADLRSAPRPTATMDGQNGRAEPPREPPPPYDREPTDMERTLSRDPVRVRRFTRDNRVDLGTLPVHRMKPGVDYEFKAHTVYNEPVPGADLAFARGQGWEPEKAKDWPELVGPGWTHDYVEVRGQVLYSRPAHLSAMAKNEDYQAAIEQRHSGVVAAATGRGLRGGEGIPNVRGLNVVHAEVSIGDSYGVKA